MRVKDFTGRLSPEIVARLDDLIEVSPGIVKRVADSTFDDAIGALEAANETTMNHEEIGLLWNRALAEHISVPDPMLDRVIALRSLRGNPDPRVFRDELRSIRDELRDLVSSCAGTRL